MPYEWVRMRNGTPERLEPYVNDPARFKREVHQIVAERGGGLDELFFPEERGVAYALIHVFDETTDVEGIRSELEAEQSTRLLTVEDLPEHSGSR